MRIVLAMLVLMSGSDPRVDPDPQRSGALPRVRGVSPIETRLIHDLLKHSTTGRLLVAEIAHTDLIVYVQLTADQSAGRAATRFAAAGPLYRYLRIVLGASTHPRDRPALLAHELQHALEIGQATEVRDDEGLRRLYREIGEDRHAMSAFETAAARDIGARVQREMGRSPGP